MYLYILDIQAINLLSYSHPPFHYYYFFYKLKIFFPKCIAYFMWTYADLACLTDS